MAFYSEEELRRIGFKSIGNNVKISKLCSVYSPENIIVSDNVRIDDFTMLSASQGEIIIGSNVHIAVFCAVYGAGGVEIRDFAGLSSRVVLYSATDDYSGRFLTNPTVPSKYLNVIKGKIVLNKHVIIGTNSTVLPSVNIGEGSAVGAHSLVNKDLGSWGVYMGSPVRKINERAKKLLDFEAEYLSNNYFRG
ncbi:acyltransferase [Bacillus sp. 3255]|uniref:acyltransferase n=1 Tax=Bacillus sp. 3255 TaxID=2817904 RepID=UPI0028567535|nr:acyltransferase [Bacillus sp. 3255]MDR6883468.1 galactoside O-acetyltransferase [Bacillus sp. 3255]